MNLYLLTALFLSVNLAAPASAQTAVKQFGDWRLACAGEPASCALSFEARRASDRTVVLKAQIVSQAEGGPLLLASTPWGVALRRGLGVQIDGAEMVRYAFEFCDPAGCHLAIDLSQGLLKKLQRGRMARFEFFDRAGEPLTIPASLTGFTKGVKALEAS